MNTGIIKKLLEATRNKKRKNHKIVMLAKSKFSSIETLISRALINLEISHKELQTIVNATEKYEKVKEGIAMMKSSDKLNKEKGKKIKTTKF